MELGVTGGYKATPLEPVNLSKPFHFTRNALCSFYKCVQKDWSPVWILVSTSEIVFLKSVFQKPLSMVSVWQHQEESSWGTSYTSVCSSFNNWTTKWRVTCVIQSWWSQHTRMELSSRLIFLSMLCGSLEVQHTFSCESSFEQSSDDTLAASTWLV